MDWCVLLTSTPECVVSPRRAILSFFAAIIHICIEISYTHFAVQRLNKNLSRHFWAHCVQVKPGGIIIKPSDGCNMLKMVASRISIPGLDALVNLLMSFTVNWMENNYTHYKVWDQIVYTFPNFNSCTVKVLEWLSNFTPHFPGHVITYPGWD